MSAERLRYIAGIAASSLSGANWERGSVDDVQADRFRRHVYHDFFVQLVELGEKIRERQRSTIGMAKLPFHALVQDALQEMES